MELFARLQNTYGHRFASLLPDRESKIAAMRDWHQQLKGITDAEIENGFDRLGSRDSELRKWPPSSFEFRELCRPHREPYERTEFQGNALPLHPASPETARKHLDALRGRMRGES